ncbi:unnamed protein product [Clonostachys rhizophaga]|uniref:DUF6546 domain-containing protein n=1 Tax=Clonostachys rhizophaga TaxID=160324 RepID=A0A9N9VGD5_9HYPO|nr:unnamed protein product [Clonostachys rhizophaga]
MASLLLPPEILLMILEEIIKEERTLWYYTPTGDGKCYNISRLATVCRRWQPVVEEYTFKHLVLGEATIPTFQMAISSRPMRLRCVEHIWLRIELPEYGCDVCGTEESEETAEAFYQRNNQIFSSCISNLFGVLSCWKPEIHGCSRHISRGLTLEICAISPSDNGHCFYSCTSEAKYPFLTEEDLDKTPNLGEYHHDCDARRTSGSECHIKHGAEFLGQVKRVYGTALRLLPGADALKKAPIVKGLLLRRSAYRSIHPASLAQILEQSLMALEWLRLERRHAVDSEKESAFIQDFIHRLMPALPSSLKGLFLTQDTIPTFGSARLSFTQSEELARAITGSSASSQLSDFCAGYQLHATAFLISVAFSTIKWNNLQRMCLRSTEFSKEDLSSDYVQIAIYDAAQAARNLPNLRLMEIFGSHRSGTACLLRYEVQQNQAALTWRVGGGKYVPVDDQALELWEGVPAFHGINLPLQINEQPLLESSDEIQDSHFDRFLYQRLELKNHIWDPVTMAQIENERREMAKLGLS